MTDYGIIPGTGAYGTEWASHFVLPQGYRGSISSAGWTVGNEGFVQQTFLGASIRNFDVNAGFGDTTSSLSVRLVNDEFNTSDGTGLGAGDDPYHNGRLDTFLPPVVGSPVFFKFGKNPATIEQAWRKTFDDLYGFNTLGTITFPTYTTTGDITSVPAHNYLASTVSGVNTWVDKSSLFSLTNANRGYAHFVFGGILQTYTQTRSSEGNPLYNVTVQDPREILSNCELILKNYAGTTFGNKNLFNLYGFLEYDVTDALMQQIQDIQPTVNTLTKFVSNTGAVNYTGDDTYIFPSTYNIPTTGNGFPQVFPITGQGYARVSEKGIPWYRVYQALTALFEFNGPLPTEYKNKSFGGVIDFRGYKYVVDFSGIPLNLIPNMYFLDFDKIDMLSLAQELCDAISHDLYITLLPVINHPACQWIYNQNALKMASGDYSNIITGIIRVDTINRTKQPQYGAIKSYLDNLITQGIYVESEDVGYEVSNVVTDRFIVGAQETEMYYFHNNRDRDNLELRKFKNGQENFYEILQGDQWSLETSLKQQILPFYGFLGKDAVTIPRGFGPYQQIMLDSSSVDAHGVGNYYVATEMELRAAIVSYGAWKDFLVLYNERYMSEVGEDQLIQQSIASKIPSGVVIAGLNDSKLLNREFAVDVPRCVFNSDKPYMGDDGYPANPCSPPYGYPLYYKRAEKIGIPEGGLTEISSQKTKLFSNLAQAFEGKEYSEALVDDFSIKIAEIEKQQSEYEKAGASNKAKELGKEITSLKQKRATAEANVASLGQQESIINTTLNLNKQTIKSIDRLSKETIKNSRKVYNFVREVAERHLGRTFLVKIPNKANAAYNKNITIDPNTFEVNSGPFGFKPQPINTAYGYASSSGFFGSEELAPYVTALNLYRNTYPYEYYLDNSNLASGLFPKYTYGALKTNFNPLSENWEHNYSPESQGGFFNFALYENNLSFSESKSVDDNHLPLLSQQQLTPLDLTNFVENNGRLKCYVRYDNSQHLDFAAISKDNIVQQKITVDGYVPDIMEEINNTSQDDLQSFDAIAQRINEGDIKPKAVAFVKCDLDSKFYLAPQIEDVTVDVFARNVKTVTQNSVLGFIPVTGVDGCVTQTPVQNYPVVTYVPATSGGLDGTQAVTSDFVRRYDPYTNANVIATELEELDSDHVYAIITIPGKVQPSVDSRYLDSVYQALNTPQIKSLLTVDVVKGVAGFEKPAYKAKSKNILNPDCSIIDGQAAKITFKDLTNAIAAAKDSRRNFGSSLPELSVGYTSPSPVYPDVVSIPLTSNERCYGPWLSSAVSNNPLADPNIPTYRYSNIGGKVEFIKDESLAPWNYAGYQLMNEAGALKAQFSNSLLLFVERGGFIMAEAPTGIALARELQNLGPLVTSITVNVDSSIKTTVKMDLYTSRFGKLQKQKELAISQAARERQRIIDQRNTLIKNGGGEGGKNFGEEYKKFANIKSVAAESDAVLSHYEKKSTVYDRIVANLKLEQDTVINLNTNEDITANNSAVHMSVQSEQFNQEILQNFSDVNAFEQNEYYSVSKTWDEIAIPYTNDTHHGSAKGGFACRVYNNEQAQHDMWAL